MRQNLIIQGGIFHEFSETTNALIKLLDSLGFKSNVFDEVEEGLEQLTYQNYSLLTINALRWEMDGEKYDPYREEWAMRLSKSAKDAIISHLEKGGAILGIHTASICFSDWEEWPKILGGSWEWGASWHPNPEKISLIPTKHELAVNNEFAVIDELYTNLNVCDESSILLEGSCSSSLDPQPVLWLNEYRSGRVVYDSLGHTAESILHTEHASWLKSTVEWATNISKDLSR